MAVGERYVNCADVQSLNGSWPIGITCFSTMDCTQRAGTVNTADTPGLSAYPDCIALY